MRGCYMTWLCMLTLIKKFCSDESKFTYLTISMNFSVHSEFFKSIPYTAVGRFIIRSYIKLTIYFMNVESSFHNNDLHSYTKY